jgi:peptidoglycan-N-acetylglucosamine deacetylase
VFSRSLLLVVAVTALGSAPLPASGADPDAGVALVSPRDGDRVTGLVEIEATTDGVVLEVTFEWSSNAGVSWQLIATDATPADGWTATWDTRPYSGPALVRASSNATVIGESDEVAVAVDNLAPAVAVAAAPDPFSPNGDGRKDEATIVVSVSEAASLEIRVTTPAGAVKRTWTRRRDRGGTETIRWNGRAGGRVLPDGAYRIVVEAEDRVGLRSTDRTAIVLDTTAPRVRILGLSPDPLGSEPRLTARIEAVDRGRVRATLAFVDAAGRTLGRVAAEGPSGRRQLRWRARTRRGALFPGTYLARLQASDEAGNVSRAAERRWRVHRQVRGTVYRRLDGAGRKVALTFDDCHVPGAWARILDVLRAKRVGATFFCPGGQVLANRDLAKRTVREGHTPAGHAWDHAALGGLGADATAWRLRRDENAWWDVTGVGSAPYFRPPYGSYDGAIVSGASAAWHPRVMMWDVDPLDWQRPGSSAIASRVLSNASAGSVILLHTLDQTAAALPSIIDGLRRRGLEPVTLPVLFRAAGLP